MAPSRTRGVIYYTRNAGCNSVPPPPVYVSCGLLLDPQLRPSPPPPPKHTPFDISFTSYATENNSIGSTNPTVISVRSDRHELFLFDFPVEIRLLIYSFVFATTRIVIEPINGREEMRIYREPGSGMSILRTSKAVYQEALPILQGQTDTIHVTQTQRRLTRRAIAQIPEDWCDKIKTIEYETLHPRVHLQYSEFPNLQAICIGTKVYHVHEHDKPKDEDVGNMVLDKARKAQKSLVGLGASWVQSRPQVKVILKALLFNRLRGFSKGWIAEINTADFEVTSVKKAEFKYVPPPKPPQERTWLPASWVPAISTCPNNWRSRTDAWEVKLLH